MRTRDYWSENIKFTKNEVYLINMGYNQMTHIGREDWKNQTGDTVSDWAVKNLKHEELKSMIKNKFGCPSHKKYQDVDFIGCPDCGEYFGND